jgi:hypothetical protein
MHDLAYHPRQSPRGPPIPGFKQALSPFVRFIYNNPIYTGAWKGDFVAEGGRYCRPRAEGDWEERGWYLNLRTFFLPGLIIVPAFRRPACD